MNLNELNNTIDFLQKLKKEEEKKQLEVLQIKIKEEMLKEIESVLMNFESDSIVKFKEETKKNACFSYNEYVIMERLKEILEVDVWEVK